MTPELIIENNKLTGFKIAGNLGEFIVPDGVKTISANAFKYQKFSKIIMSKTVEKIEPSTFSANYFLEEIDLSQSKIKEIPKCCFYDCPNLKKVSLPDTLEEIGISSFFYCENIKEITFPESLLLIDIEAFNRCNSLRKVTLPKNLRTIESRAFQNCENLEKVVFPDNTFFTEIPTGCFENCHSLEKVVLPDTIAKIEASAFSHCFNLKEITLSKNLEAIYNSAFAYCTSLEEINIPKNIKLLQNCLFAGCNSLKRINIPCEVEAIEKNAFALINDNFKIVTLHKNFENFENELYLKCLEDHIIYTDKTLDDMLDEGYSIAHINKEMLKNSCLQNIENTVK